MVSGKERYDEVRTSAWLLVEADRPEATSEADIGEGSYADHWRASYARTVTSSCKRS